MSNEVDYESAMHYNGDFDLTFLRDGETVAAIGDGTPNIRVYTAPNDHNGIRLDVGDWLIREPRGGLWSCTDAEWRRRHEAGI